VSIDREKIEQLLSVFLQRSSAETRRSYRADLDGFRGYLSVDSLAAAVGLLLNSPPGQACLTVLHYRAILRDQGLRSATCNRKLSTLRSLVKTANALGMVTWHLDVNNEKASRAALTPPPVRSDLQRLFTYARQQPKRAKGARDYALLRLMHDLALKRSVVAGLDLSALDWQKSRLTVITGSCGVPVQLALPPPTVKALEQWIVYRGAAAGPLFTNFDQAGKGDRLSATSIYRIVRQLGNRVGIDIGPNRLRHAAISADNHRTRHEGAIKPGG
jgi:integrase/recombinase XerC